MSRADDKAALAHAIGIWSALKRKPHEGVNLRIGLNREEWLPAVTCEAIERALIRERNRL